MSRASKKIVQPGKGGKPGREIIRLVGKMRKNVLFHLLTLSEIFANPGTKVFVPLSVSLQNICKTRIQWDNILMIDPFIRIVDDLTSRKNPLFQSSVLVFRKNDVVPNNVGDVVKTEHTAYFRANDGVVAAGVETLGLADIMEQSPGDYQRKGQHLSWGCGGFVQVPGKHGGDFGHNKGVLPDVVQHAVAFHERITPADIRYVVTGYWVQ